MDVKDTTNDWSTETKVEARRLDLYAGLTHDCHGSKYLDSPVNVFTGARPGS